MEDLEPLIRLFAAADDLLERCEPVPWGAVVTDSRIPLIYDANYARVEDPSASVADVRRRIGPALDRAGARHEHVVLFRPQESARLLEELEAAGGRFTYDTAMRFAADRPPSPAHPVEEVDVEDDGFWEVQRSAVAEFHVRDPATVDQLLWWERRILTPAGKRWFVVREGGHPAGIGALFLAARVAYVDNVVTFPEFRRRGVASSVTARIVAEAGRAGAMQTYLLADDPGPIRLYERLGFAAVGQVVGWLRTAP